MKGRRRDDCEPHLLLRCQYHLAKDGSVYFVDPNGNFGHAVAPTWTITVHDDETITISPSLYVNQGRPNEWHGFLERGVWRQV